MKIKQKPDMAHLSDISNEQKLWPSSTNAPQSSSRIVIDHENMITNKQGIFVGRKFVVCVAESAVTFNIEITERPTEPIDVNAGIEYRFIQQSDACFLLKYFGLKPSDIAEVFHTDSIDSKDHAQQVIDDYFRGLDVPDHQEKVLNNDQDRQSSFENKNDDFVMDDSASEASQVTINYDTAKDNTDHTSVDVKQELDSGDLEQIDMPGDFNDSFFDKGEHSSIKKLLSSQFGKNPDDSINNTKLTIKTTNDSKPSAKKARKRVRIKKFKIKKKSTCTECGFIFKRPADLNKHMRIHTGETPYTCAQCPFTTAWHGTLKRHVITKHTEGRPIKCPDCSYTCKETVNLKQHYVNKHTGDLRPYKCMYCGHACKQYITLKQHIRGRHTGDKPYKCTMCPYVSVANIQLKNHIMRKHTGETPFKCDECDYKTIRRGDLKKHQMMHTGDFPFICSICGYKTTGLSSLKQHTRVNHTHEHPFMCSYCGYTCTHSSSLTRHVMAKHTGERPFKCPKCDYVATCQYHINRHVMCIHNNEKPYLCSACDFRASSNGNLKKHTMARHTGEKPYMCNMCDYRSTQSNALKKHMMKHLNVPVNIQPFQQNMMLGYSSMH